MKTYNGDEQFYECPHCGGRIPTDWDALDYGGYDFEGEYTEYSFDCACGKQIRILDVDGTVEVWGQGERKMILNTYCEVCKENGVKDDGCQDFEMELVNVDELDLDHCILVFEGKCPVCGTIYQLFSERTEVDWDFHKKESE